MNTPAHLLVNLALLSGGARRPHARAIAAGALLPDLPMFGFFFWERFVLGTPSHTIWGERYFELGWQNFFDLFNSLPILAVLFAAAWALESRRSTTRTPWREAGPPRLLLASRRKSLPPLW